MGAIWACSTAAGRTRYGWAEDLWMLRWNRLSQPEEPSEDLNWMKDW